jgi:hypothetical protein
MERGSNSDSGCAMNVRVSPWLRVWLRAVIAPAGRRASGVWVGAGIGGGIVFGPTGMQPRDLTGLALHVPLVGCVLALTWLLLYVPTARMIVREEGGMYLRSLPASRWPPRVLAVLALVGLQLPWLALWVIGDGARGLALVLALTGAIALVALWRPRPRRAGWPRWQSDRAALRGVYVRALRRRATDALVRGVGLAVLAGLVAGLVVRNNALAGERGAVLGAGTIAIVLIPGWAGALLPLVEAHRASAWLASSLGITALARSTVLAMTVAGVYLLGAAIAVAATAVFLDAATIAWLALTAVVTAIGMALTATRTLVRAERDDKGAATRVVSGAIVASALAVICLGWLGLAGAPLMLVVGVCALLTARST